MQTVSVVGLYIMYMYVQLSIAICIGKADLGRLCRLYACSSLKYNVSYLHSRGSLLCE